MSRFRTLRLSLGGVPSERSKGFCEVSTNQANSRARKDRIEGFKQALRDILEAANRADREWHRTEAKGRSVCIVVVAMIAARLATFRCKKCVPRSHPRLDESIC